MVRPAGDAVDGLRVRPSRVGDLDAVMDLARQTGGGFTSLPADEDAVGAKLAGSVAALDPSLQCPEDASYWLVMEDMRSGEVVGTAAIFSRIGRTWPFYSFRRAKVSHISPTIGRYIDHRVLYLANDFNGCTEVGGLFLRPDRRNSRAGALLARSRYLFMARNPERFADTVMAELRGWQDPTGSSPFWDAVGARFFGMTFAEADRFGALAGNQFIADLLPRHPIYEATLPLEAQAVIGRPHDASAPAMALLEREGFRHDGLVDVFDAGPCLSCARDEIATVRNSAVHVVAALRTDEANSVRCLVANGRLGDFVCLSADTTLQPDGTCFLSPEVAATLQVGVDDAVLVCPERHACR